MNNFNFVSGLILPWVLFLCIPSVPVSATMDRHRRIYESPVLAMDYLLAKGIIRIGVEDGIRGEPITNYSALSRVVINNTDVVAMDEVLHAMMVADFDLNRLPTTRMRNGSVTIVRKSLLIRAVQSCSAEVVRALVTRYGLHLHGPGACAEGGRPLLLHICVDTVLELAPFLIERGADVNAKIVDGAGVGHSVLAYIHGMVAQLQAACARSGRDADKDRQRVAHLQILKEFEVLLRSRGAEL